ncbi:bifunctional methylenetetrahydrofolate dehydrogenase/methenyltetrahydrofolate cyclohydrolase FolD [bacterium]|nr:bifunctional methylenetetrahydrofolate dehydrogenase/methenyltetrahydrofolate cyclohydrolase FolD [bacterium]
MSCKILDGKVVSESVLSGLCSEIRALLLSTGRDPGLAVVLVGDNPASKFYVESKKKACQKIGINSYDYRLPATASEGELCELIRHLNNDPEIHGILVQLPLPNGFDEQKIVELISPEKDVDGFHPVNVGRVLQGISGFKSCTPYGVLELLRYYDIDVAGKHVVIVGRSNIVGKPLASLLIQRGPGADATVTICHSKSENVRELTARADVVVAAIGVPEFLTAEMVKPGAVVVDVGINRVDDPNAKNGYRIVGDVNYAMVKKNASAITPVPGGVGPMTIAMLMKNTVESFKKSLGGLQ